MSPGGQSDVKSDDVEALTQFLYSHRSLRYNGCTVQLVKQHERYGQLRACIEALEAPLHHLPGFECHAFAVVPDCRAPQHHRQADIVDVRLVKDTNGIQGFSQRPPPERHLRHEKYFLFVAVLNCLCYELVHTATQGVPQERCYQFDTQLQAMAAGLHRSGVYSSRAPRSNRFTRLPADLQRDGVIHCADQHLVMVYHNDLHIRRLQERSQALEHVAHLGHTLGVHMR